MLHHPIQYSIWFSCWGFPHSLAHNLVQNLPQILICFSYWGVANHSLRFLLFFPFSTMNNNWFAEDYACLAKTLNTPLNRSNLSCAWKALLLNECSRLSCSSMCWLWNVDILLADKNQGVRMPNSSGAPWTIKGRSLMWATAQLRIDDAWRGVSSPPAVCCSIFLSSLLQNCTPLSATWRKGA